MVLPLFVCASVVVIVDPYNLFGVTSVVDNQVKLKCSSNAYLWKSIEFMNQPVDKILLGDSRSEAIDAQYIKQLTGETYYNFACGGATLPDIVRLFWHADKYSKLKKVYIGLNLDIYNANFKGKTVEEVEAVIDNKLLYLIDKNVTISIYRILTKYHQRQVATDSPKMSKKDFWQHKLGIFTNRVYGNYKYPSEYLVELTKIADYCNQNNIQLTFLILPTHVDLQTTVRSYQLSDAEQVFRNDLKKLATVFDFDYDNDLTHNFNNFNDPYHLIDTKPLVNEVWGVKLKYAKVSGGPKLIK